MVRRAQYICFVLILVAMASTVYAQEAITNIVKQLKPAVVTVITYDTADVPSSQGSGFFIDASHVVTNWHVVEDAVKVKVKCDDGSEYTVKRVAAGDEKIDLVSLELDKPNLKVVPLKIASSLPQAGERVVVIGSPYGLESSISDGIVSEVRDIPDLGHVIQISAPVSRGSSGSPVVNMNGEVVGVAQAVEAGGQNLNFAVPANLVYKLKQPAHSPIASSPAGAGAGPGSSAQDSYEKGKALVAKDAYSEALPYFLQAVKENPKHYLAWFSAGRCYMQAEDYPKATQAYMNAIKAKPDFTEAYISLGAALGIQDQYDAAIQAFKKAIALEPDQALAHYGLGLMYVATNNSEGALREYKVLQSLDSGLAAKLFGTIYQQ